MASHKSLSSKIAFFALPLLVFLMVLAITRFIAHQGNCHEWGELCWSRQDSGLYLQIAGIGHTLFHCGPEFGYPENSEVWCGNAGWAPFYPMLMFMLSKACGLDLPTAGIVLSLCFMIGFLYIAALFIEVKSFALSNWLTLFICAICPGGIYYFAIFPMSLMIFLLAMVFYGLKSNRFILTTIGSFLLPLTYSSAIVILFAFGLYLALLWFKRAPFASLNVMELVQNSFNMLREHIIFKTVLLRVLLPGILGLLGLYIYDYWATGHWNAMFLIQEKYGHGLYSPFKHLKGHWHTFQNLLYTKEAWVSFHNVFFFFALPFLCLLIYRTKAALSALVIVFSLCIWYFPFSIGMHVSLYRGIGLLAPALIFLHPVSHLKKIILALVFGVFYYFMGVLFIYDILK